MNAAEKVELVIVGSLALDTVETPAERREEVLGGSVSYACAAASFFVRTGMVAVAGADFPRRHLRLYERFGIDLAGLQIVEGKTFRWSGVYETDMNRRRTLSTELNVFADFRPSLPESYKSGPFLFLANISPELQLHVLSEMRRPRFVAADTMDLWINTAKTALLKVVSRVDMLTLNDSEARMLAGEENLVRAARKVLGLGPRYVAIKKGEHGALLFSRSGVVMAPAYPLEDVCDPTGAGDTFAGGFMGYLAKDGRVGLQTVRSAMLYGSVLASFGVQGFGLDGLASLKRGDISRRLAALRRMTALP